MSSNDSLKNIIGVALGVCLVCSILVAAATVLLKSRQDANQRHEKLKNILIAGGLMKEDDKSINVEDVFAKKIQPDLIDLKTGEQLPKEKMTGELAPAGFDIKKIAKDPETSRRIPADKDLANIKRMPTELLVYFVKDKNSYSKIIFPIYGSGLWSILYGFMALDRDLRTVRGFTIYEHGETPGLGGEVDNPKWKALWNGKIAFDPTGKFELRVIKGTAPPGSTTEIDGLSGATLTTRGVDHMIAFWFGPDGYGPFLDKLRKERGMEGTHE
jgi:Na+-transporting NADH:ubiquinone oxidoreductase subunit C